jgi:hypothetical protein
MKYEKETTEINKFLDLEIPTEEGNLKISDQIESISAIDSELRLSSPRYVDRIVEIRRADVTKYMKRNPISAEELLRELQSCIPDLDEITYQKVLSGETNYLRQGISNDVVIHTQRILLERRNSVTSADIRRMLFDELQQKIRGDYHSCLWQLY